MQLSAAKLRKLRINQPISRKAGGKALQLNLTCSVENLESFAV
jgi:hypothetical protein